MKGKPRKSSVSRRLFLGVGAAGLTTPALALEPDAAPQTASASPQPAAGGLDVATLRTAQGVSGLRLSDDALAKALPLVTRYRSHVEALRAMPAPEDLEPAFGFDPRRVRRRAPLQPASASPAAPRSAAGRKAPQAPGSEDDIAYATLDELRAWLDAGQVTPQRLMDLSLDRLARYDEALSTVVTLADRRGRLEAQAATGRNEPLSGIPFGAKDLFDSAGVRTLWGAHPYRERPVPKRDATALERLKNAGACLAAKLSTGELAVGDVWFGEPQREDGTPLRPGEGARGRKTRNPWNPETGASGSSAGPAAAVAAGLVPFALGTETGGSIVSPASTCGVTGLRPTYGRVSRAGVMTLRWTLDKVGVLARSVSDCARVLAAIHGPDGLDRSVSSAPFSWQSPGKAARLRLGIVERELFPQGNGADADARKAATLTKPVFEAAIDVFRRAGWDIVPVTLPPFPAAALYAIHNAEAGAMFDEITRNGAIDFLEGQGPSDRSSQLRASRFIPAVDYLRAQRVRNSMIAAVEALFESVDLFLAPPSSDSVNMTNLTGHPALVLPAGFVRGESGPEMPQNIMLTGRLDDEATLLDAGFVFERETDWRRRRPPLFISRG